MAIKLVGRRKRNRKRKEEEGTGYQVRENLRDLGMTRRPKLPIDLSDQPEVKVGEYLDEKRRLHAEMRQSLRSAAETVATHPALAGCLNRLEMKVFLAVSAGTGPRKVEKNLNIDKSNVRNIFDRATAKLARRMKALKNSPGGLPKDLFELTMDLFEQDFHRVEMDETERRLHRSPDFLHLVSRDDLGTHPEES